MGLITELLSKNEMNGKSRAIISIQGTDTLARHKSHVTYKVLEGSMVVTVNNEIYPLTKGDRISIEPFTPYKKEGIATILALDTPPFDFGSLEIIEE